MTQKNRTQDRDRVREGRERQAECSTNGYITAVTSVSLPKPHSEGVEVRSVFA